MDLSYEYKKIILHDCSRWEDTCSNFATFIHILFTFIVVIITVVYYMCN